MAIITAGLLGLDFDQLDLSSLVLTQLFSFAPSGFTATTGFQSDAFTGSGFLYAGAGGAPSAGVINQIQETFLGQTVFIMSGLNLQATQLNDWIATGAGVTAKLSILGGDDVINGSDVTDRLRGYGGDDTINGNGGDDYIDGGTGNNSIHGGVGNDVIVVTSGTNYLRGDDGNDYIQGGTGFDDINGNKGNDTIDGGAGGSDWLVGGQGDDLITAHTGQNILYGNLGNDTLTAGFGGDVVRGGQGDDSIVGGAGNDFISGDRGNDTESGGAGADIFHGSQDAGIDRVLDFSQAQGDRVQLDPGTTYNLSQVGADTVIDMGAGNQMILVGVRLASLTNGWIFLG